MFKIIFILLITFVHLFKIEINGESKTQRKLKWTWWVILHENNDKLL
jgi:hypothetical protein